MLLTDCKEIYIGNNSVKEVYYNNKKLFPIETLANPFDIYTFAEIKDIVLRGDAPNLIPLGTEFTFTTNSNRYTHTAMVVDYVYNDKPTLVCLWKRDFENYWCGTNRSEINYLDSYIHSSATSIYEKIDTNLKSVLCKRNFKIYDSKKCTTTTSFSAYLVSPSISEIYPKKQDDFPDHGQLAFFEKNPNYLNENGKYAWTRSNSTIRFWCVYTWKGTSDFQENDYYTSSRREKAYLYQLFFIGD